MADSLMQSDLVSVVYCLAPGCFARSQSKWTVTLTAWSVMEPRCCSARTERRNLLVHSRNALFLWPGVAQVLPLETDRPPYQSDRVLACQCHGWIIEWAYWVNAQAPWTRAPKNVIAHWKVEQRNVSQPPRDTKHPQNDANQRLCGKNYRKEAEKRHWRDANNSKTTTKTRKTKAYDNQKRHMFTSRCKITTNKFGTTT